VIAAILACLVLSGTAGADMILTDGYTHTVNTSLPVENISLSNSTTLDLAPGGSVTGAAAAPANTAYAVSASFSTVTLDGGSVAAGNASFDCSAIYAADSAVTVNSGTITGATASFAYGISGSNDVINVYGGNINGGNSNVFGTAISCSSSSVNVYGGVISGGPASDAIDAGVINVHAGTVLGKIQASAGLNIYAGTITTQDTFGCAISTSAGGNLRGGVITGSVAASAGVLNIYGGNITGSGAAWNYGVDCKSSSKINISGGSVTVNAGGDWNSAIFDEGGTVNLTGGDITYTGPFNAGWSSGIRAQSGTINIYGSDFDYPSGPIADISGTLTGTLSDGSTIDLTFYQASPGEIVLYTTPEPATLSLLALGGVAMLRRRVAA
jgi:hypothetical protein